MLGRPVGRVIAVVRFLTLPSFTVPNTATGKVPSTRKRLLSLNDLPAGWKIEHGSRHGNGFSRRCLKRLTPAPIGVSRGMVRFRSGAGLQRQSLEEALVKSPRAVDMYLKIVNDFAQCRTVTYDFHGRAQHEEISWMPFPTLGARSAA